LAGDEAVGFRLGSVASVQGRTIPWLLALGMLAGCTQRPALPTSHAPARTRTVTTAPAAVRQQVERTLRELGFTIRQDAALTLVGDRVGEADPAWAQCGLTVATDPDTDTNRRSFERPVGLRTTVVVRITVLGQATNVSLDLLHAGQYRNPYANFSFEESCPSAGGLEQRLLDATAHLPSPVLTHPPPVLTAVDPGP
jgi:hypothetical protein